MTKKERIAELERLVAQLELRVETLRSLMSAQPVSTSPLLPTYWPFYTTITCMDNGDGRTN